MLDEVPQEENISFVQVLVLLMLRPCVRLHRGDPHVGEGIAGK